MNFQYGRKRAESTIETTSNEKKTAFTKKGKLIFKIITVSALLSVVLLFSGFCAVGNSHDISIENGFVNFVKDTAKIVFFGEKEEEFIPVSVLLTDLEQHGYKDIAFPQEFIDNAGKYKVTLPDYFEDSFGKQVSFFIYGDVEKYSFSICSHDPTQNAYSYKNLDNVDTIVLNDVYVYVFEFDAAETIEFFNGEFYYFISSNTPYSDMVKIAKSIK